MVRGHWALSRQLCRHAMVDTVEAMVLGVLIVMAQRDQITIGSDTEMMIVIHTRPQREPRIMNPGETLITTRDRRRIHVFVRAVTLMMMRKMIGRDDPNRFLLPYEMQCYQILRTISCIHGRTLIARYSS